MAIISIEDIASRLPINTQPNTESIAIRLLKDQDRVADSIYVELVMVRDVFPSLRATFHATSNAFMQARIFLTRKLVPMTLADCVAFTKIVSELAAVGERNIICNDAASSLFAKYQIELNAQPIPKTKSRPPRSSEHGNPI